MALLRYSNSFDRGRRRPVPQPPATSGRGSDLEREGRGRETFLGTPPTEGREDPSGPRYPAPPADGSGRGLDDARLPDRGGYSGMTYSADASGRPYDVDALGLGDYGDSLGIADSGDVRADLGGGAAYYPQYTPTQQTGGPEFRSSGTGQQLAENDRLMTQHAGNALDQDFTNSTNYEGGLRNRYRNIGDQAYLPMVRGENVGYTPDEQRRMVDEEGLNALQLGDTEYSESYLNDAERSAIQGDPYLARRNFRPEIDDAIQSEGAARQREAYQKMQGGLDAAAGNEALRLRQGFADDLTGAVDSTEGQISGYLDPDRLNVSDSFLEDYKLTPEEQQRIVTAAGMDVRDRYQGQIDDLGRRARAEGVNAAGAAAMQERLQRTAAAGAGDQMTRARVQADAEAANRLATGENMRLRYGQNLAGMQTDAALNTGSMRQGALRTGEQMRLGSEQDVSNRKMSAAEIGGNAQARGELAAQDRAADAQRYITQTGIDLDRSADTAASNRAAMLSTNRQDASVRNQNERFRRGAYASDSRFNRYRTTGDARRQDQSEARGYVTGQGTMASRNEQAGLDRRGQLYSTQGQLAQGSTANKLRGESQPGKWERLIGGGLQAGVGLAKAFAGGGGGEKGRIVTKPSMMLLGEDGPEMVVPLGVDPEAEVMPSAALSMMPQSFDTSAPPMRKQSAYSFRYHRA